MVVVFKAYNLITHNLSHLFHFSSKKAFNLMKQGEISYCGQIVREHDPDRFLLSHFAPFDRREGLWALYAFNYEIAKTREVVSETQLGLIRLQWWRDAVATIYDEGAAVPEHAVVQAMARAVDAYDLPREDFDALIYAREFDLEDVLPSDLEGWVHYADYTSVPLLKWAARIVGADVDMEPIAAVGVNYAVAGILRASVSFARQRRCYLPQDLMVEHDVSVNKLYELKRQDGLVDVVRAVAETFVDGVKCEDRFLRAHQRLAALYMGQLKRLGYDVFDGRLMLPPAFKALRLYLDL